MGGGTGARFKSEGEIMGAHSPRELSKLFEEYFRDGDLDQLMTLYEDDAMFPTAHSTATGAKEIRTVLQAYLDSGAKLAFADSLVFQVDGLALTHTPWTMESTDGSKAEGATAEVVRRQTDGTWRYIIDSPDGTALLKQA